MCCDYNFLTMRKIKKGELVVTRFINVRFVLDVKCTRQDIFKAQYGVLKKATNHFLPIISKVFKHLWFKFK